MSEEIQPGKTWVRTLKSLEIHEAHGTPARGSVSHDPSGGVHPGAVGKVTSNMTGMWAMPGEWWEVEFRRGKLLYVAYARTEDLEVVQVAEPPDADFNSGWSRETAPFPRADADRERVEELHVQIRQALALEQIATSLESLLVMCREDLEMSSKIREWHSTLRDALKLVDELARSGSGSISISKWERQARELLGEQEPEYDHLGERR